MAAKFGEDARMWLVFHGGSGSELSHIHETLGYGVIKMNVDTDAQYWFTKAVVANVDENRAEMIHSDDAMADKKKFDPRSYLKSAEKSMAERVTRACKDLKSNGKSIFSS